MVEVCAICDIAGCHHIRSRAAMTDPTPTRAEVEAHDLAEQGRHAISALWQRCETLTAQRNALRERAEAAEAERDRQYDENVNRIAMQARAENERDAARRAEAAAWNDAIEAAAQWAEDGFTCRACNAPFLTSVGHYDEDCPKGRASWDGLPRDQLPIRIRALRRAAPTEGEA
ncbi:hypothetical protein CP157_01097 [Paracoccus marcusii]|nr:hypothetical protein CP157_01097 [Paracoccus marcusii]